MTNKILLVTIHNANNYGAIFQAYALQEILKEYGDVEVLDYNNKHISISFRLIRIKLTIHGMLGMGKDVFRLFPRYRVIRKFKSFIENHFNLSERHEKNRSFDCGKYKFLVSGSDQIWNPACISDNLILDPTYFLEFGSKHQSKISYASSMGAYNFNGEEKQQLKGYLSSYKSISVREFERKTYLEEILPNTNVEHVLDPSLLLSKDKWIDLAKKKDFKHPFNGEKYILLYTVPKVKLIRKAIKYYKKRTGLKVVSVEQGLSAGANVDKHIMDAGPYEFLQLFLHAELVITDSFHGTCFSLNFNKKFVSVSPGKNVNRIESILRELNLKERILYSEKDFEKVDESLTSDLDTKLLDNLRNRSFQFLNNSFK